MARERLGDILIHAGLLDSEGLQRALEEKKKWGGPLGQHLVQLKLVEEDTLIRALSKQYKLPAVALEPRKMNVEVAHLIPQTICDKYQLICFRADNELKFLDVALADPTDLDAIDEVRVVTKCNVRVYIGGPMAIQRAITHLFYRDLSLGGEVAAPTEDTSAAQKSESPNSVGLYGAAADGESALPAETKSDSGFHITMDLSEVVLESGSNLGERLAHLQDKLVVLEEKADRDRGMINLLIGLLVKKGVFSAEEIKRLTGAL
jgi:hypothetical protein